MMDPLQKALTGLETEQRMLLGVPTWPWQRDTLRWVVGALVSRSCCSSCSKRSSGRCDATGYDGRRAPP